MVTSIKWFRSWNFAHSNISNQKKLIISFGSYLKFCREFDFPSHEALFGIILKRSEYSFCLFCCWRFDSCLFYIILFPSFKKFSLKKLLLKLYLQTKRGQKNFLIKCFILHSIKNICSRWIPLKNLCRLDLLKPSSRIQGSQGSQGSQSFFLPSKKRKKIWRNIPFSSPACA